MAAPSAHRGAALINNIARAYEWLRQIKRGETLGAIAIAEEATTKRIQQTLEFAFLAPDIVRAIIAGTQSVGLTSTRIAMHPIPSDWGEQRSLIAAL